MLSTSWRRLSPAAPSAAGTGAGLDSVVDNRSSGVRSRNVVSAVGAQCTTHDRNLALAHTAFDAATPSGASDGACSAHNHALMSDCSTRSSDARRADDAELEALGRPWPCFPSLAGGDSLGADGGSGIACAPGLDGVAGDATVCAAAGAVAGAALAPAPGNCAAPGGSHDGDSAGEAGVAVALNLAVSADATSGVNSAAAAVSAHSTATYVAANMDLQCKCNTEVSTYS